MGNSQSRPNDLQGMPGFLAGAHHFKIFGGKFTDKSVHNHIYSSGIQAHVPGLLANESLLDAYLHSHARSPPPRCMEGTRGELREEIQRWMSGISPRNDPWAQQFQALWLYGPMGVGKSALAQTLGEWAEQNHRLGAAVFLSEEKGRNDPRRLFISVAQQLAQKSDAYAKYIQHQLVQDDSDIRLLPTLNLTRQFRILFLKPFRSGIRFPQKLVVIVDGLDEFGGKADQDEIVQLLSGSIDTEPLTERSDLPLQWILCSRPEPHIRRILGGINIRCWKKLVPMGEEDVRFFFEKELEDIRQQNSLELDWLPRSSLDKMVRAAAGLFIYASTLVRFIRDGDRGSEKELQIVLEYIDRKTTENPLVALDELYVAVLSNTPVRRSGPSEPPPISSETHQLLGSVIFYPQLPILELANLLDLYKTGFDKALESLHAVVSVPPVDRAALDHLQFYHTSFSDFLCDPSRSNDFVLRQDEIHATFIKACFRALGQTQLRLARGLSWRTHKPNVLTVAHRVQSYAAKHVWTMCINVENPSRDLLDTIVDFDFQQLVFVKDKIPPSSFQAFAQWLLKQTEKQHRPSVVTWKELDPKIFGLNKEGEDQSCFALGDCEKAVMIHITGSYLSFQ